MSETHNRGKFQFSLKALLIILMLIAVGAGMYVVGYQRGYNAARDEYLFGLSRQKIFHPTT